MRVRRRRPRHSAAVVTLAWAWSPARPCWRGEGAGVDDALAAPGTRAVRGHRVDREAVAHQAAAFAAGGQVVGEPAARPVQSVLDVRAHLRENLSGLGVADLEQRLLGHGWP